MFSGKISSLVVIVARAFVKTARLCGQTCIFAGALLQVCSPALDIYPLRSLHFSCIYYTAGVSTYIIIYIYIDLDYGVACGYSYICALKLFSTFDMLVHTQ